MYEDIDHSTVLVRDYIRNTPARFEANEEEIRKLELETQDLLHLIEFKDLDIQRGFRIYKELQSVRQRRRELKEENELLQPVVKTLKDIESKTYELDKAIGQIRKCKVNQNKRVYTFKIRKDLGEIWDGETI